jgi:hypothetical protein
MALIESSRITQPKKHRLYRKDASIPRDFSPAPCLPVALSPCFLVLLFLPYFGLNALEIPLEFHGVGFLGKYLNSDTIRYNMDASVEVFGTLLRHRDLSFFVRYRDDLDMAEQKGGVSLDPRYTHYYISGGIDYLSTNFLFSAYFMHDCVHDIDYDVEGTPVFNRFRLRLASVDFHDSRRLLSSQRFLWSLTLGTYPHWTYHGWDINAGADYRQDAILELYLALARLNSIEIALNPTLWITRGDSTYYHQHIIRFLSFFANQRGRIGLRLDYNVYNNDLIKNPDKLWLLSLFVEF